MRHAERVTGSRQTTEDAYRTASSTNGIAASTDQNGRDRQHAAPGRSRHSGGRLVREVADGTIQEEPAPGEEGHTESRVALIESRRARRNKGTDRVNAVSISPFNRHGKHVTGEGRSA